MTPEDRARRIVADICRDHADDPGPYGDTCRYLLDVERREQLDSITREWEGLGRTVRFFAETMSASMRGLGRGLNLDDSGGPR